MSPQIRYPTKETASQMASQTSTPQAPTTSSTIHHIQHVHVPHRAKPPNPAHTHTPHRRPTTQDPTVHPSPRNPPTLSSHQSPSKTGGGQQSSGARRLVEPAPAQRCTSSGTPAHALADLNTSDWHRRRRGSLGGTCIPHAQPNPCHCTLYTQHPPALPYLAAAARPSAAKGLT